MSCHHIRFRFRFNFRFTSYSQKDSRTQQAGGNGFYRHLQYYHAFHIFAFCLLSTLIIKPINVLNVIIKKFVQFCYVVPLSFKLERASEATQQFSFYFRKHYYIVNPIFANEDKNNLEFNLNILLQKIFGNRGN